MASNCVVKAIQAGDIMAYFVADYNVIGSYLVPLKRMTSWLLIGR